MQATLLPSGDSFSCGVDTRRWATRDGDTRVRVTATRVSRVTPPPPKYLGKVADDVGALSVHLGEEVKNERFHVEIKGFMVEEEFGQQAEVLAVDLGRRRHASSRVITRRHACFPPPRVKPPRGYLVVFAVHLVDRDVAFAVNLSSRRLPPLALALGTVTRVPPRVTRVSPSVSHACPLPARPPTRAQTSRPRWQRSLRDRPLRVRPRHPPPRLPCVASVSHACRTRVPIPGGGGRCARTSCI